MGEYSICNSRLENCRIFSHFSFFFNDTATTEIYTLSLHDALPIWEGSPGLGPGPAQPLGGLRAYPPPYQLEQDRKSTRLNSSHLVISYAVFCLKKKKNKMNIFYKYLQHTMHISYSHNIYLQ